MQNELETAMRLVGITDLSQVHPGLVNTRDIDHLVPSTGEEHGYAKWKPSGRRGRGRKVVVSGLKREKNENEKAKL